MRREIAWAAQAEAVVGEDVSLRADYHTHRPGQFGVGTEAAQRVGKFREAEQDVELGTRVVIVIIQRAPIALAGSAVEFDLQRACVELLISPVHLQGFIYLRPKLSDFEVDCHGLLLWVAGLRCQKVYTDGRSPRAVQEK